MFIPEQQIGQYTLVRRLGHGSFGEVWLAERRGKFVTTEVAVKLPLDEQVDHEAIQHEAETWRRASGHANVLPIIEADEYDGQVVIVSEFAPDGSLEDLLVQKGGKLDIKQAVEMTIGILSGLEFLHSRQIIHRDIKPANILLQNSTPRLADFGISRVMRGTSQSNIIAGTDAYMPPEAFDGKRNERTDIWAVGVVLYQMLKGTLPFPQKNRTEVFGAILTKEPESLPATIPLNLQQITLKALVKTPAGRYQNASAMRQALQDFSNEVSASVTYNDSSTIFIEQETVVRQLLETKLIPYLKGDKYGFCDSNKNIILPPKYDNAHRFSEGLAFVELNGKCKFIDKTGRKVITLKLRYDGVVPFSEGLALVILNNKRGFIDKTGREVSALKYDFIHDFKEGLALARSNDKYGFIDKKGCEITALKDYASPFSEDLARVRLDNKFGFIDKEGREVIALKYDLATDFKEGLALVMSSYKYGFIDKEGREVLALKYGYVGDFSEGLAPVASGYKYGFIDKTGCEVIALKYDYVESFSEGLALVKIEGKYGFIDKTGREVSALKYDFKIEFKEGLARVRSNEKAGFIDKKGREVIALKYDFVDDFKEGLALVTLNDKQGFIDKRGREVIALKYDYAVDFSEGFAGVMLNDKWFYIDKDGTEYYEP